VLFLLSGSSLLKRVLRRNGKNRLADQPIGGSFGVQVKEWQTAPENSMNSGPSAWAFCGTASA
jgi:hypothetical protein